MMERLIVYGIVVAAAAWTLWHLGARRWFKSRAATKEAAKCGPDCGCGD